ncbi:SDR family oxidoreductase [Pedobacter heparinus]|uniref:SDR family NAD(P)-dependent oxidoreductase n=1 Tax=Pedobacter heparinus TaxID=984 RepID=UPI0029305DD1|nr:SDR family oxidoreductase [Pedobacter heparinus]
MVKDRVLLVTASSGIGAATIKLALQQGAKVFYTARTEQSCRVFQEELNASGLEAAYLAGDLTDPDAAGKLVEGCLAKYGRIDGLFNVAGISGRRFGDGPAHECTDEGWTITLQTNVDTQFRMCREVLKVMLAQDPDEQGLRGCILNMASILGIDPEPKYFSTIAYAASKGAILSMTRTMAACYARQGIRVNAIAPGLAITKMSERAAQDAEIIEFMKQKQPLTGRIMEASEIAGPALFLLSGQSAVITGETLITAAGWDLV